MIKISTSLFTLMQLAKAFGDAKKSGDEKSIEQAEKNLRAYEKIVLKSDELNTHLTRHDIF